MTTTMTSEEYQRLPDSIRTNGRKPLADKLLTAKHDIANALAESGKRRYCCGFLLYWRKKTRSA